MIRVFFILGFFVSLMISKDLTSLRIQKRAYKQRIHLSSQKIVKKSPEKIVIVFTNRIDVKFKSLHRDFGLKLEECLVERICIFANTKKWNIAKLSILLKEENPKVDTVNIYQKRHFDRY